MCSGTTSIRSRRTTSSAITAISTVRRSSIWATRSDGWRRRRRRPCRRASSSRSRRRSSAAGQFYTAEDYHQDYHHEESDPVQVLPLQLRSRRAAAGAVGQGGVSHDRSPASAAERCRRGGGRSGCAGSTARTSRPRARSRFDKSDSEWRRILTKPQYEVLRLHHTEVPGSSPLNQEKRKGIFSLRGLRSAAVFVRDEIRERNRLAELLSSAAECGRHPHRLCPADPAHRGALPALRRASRPRVFRRAAADRAALLHERRCHEVHARRSSLIPTPVWYEPC